MAKYDLRLKARKLRSRGESVKEIAKKLNVSRGTASIWVRDIILTVEQLENLRERKIKGGELGRLRSAIKQKQKRLKLIEKSNKDGVRKIGKLSYRNMLIAGIALYWAEGSKKTREVKICNSDPRLIIFMIRWLEICFGINKQRLSLKVGINQIHQKREREVINYWSQVTDIPIIQFRKTSFKKAKNKKVYENYDSHYGTLTVSVLKPAEIYYKIMGLIEGMATAG